MSIGQLPPRRAPRATDDAKFVQYDQYIDRHIQNTRRAVKLVDWATALVALGTFVTVFLLVAAVAEHWLIPGGFSVAGRTTLFLMLTAAVGYFAYRRLWPLCRRAINPVYAAHAIEKSSPSLKNSLVNLLLFRQHRAQLSDAVYHTLEEQAAKGLTRVPVDAVVDRTTLIRVGYVLLAVVAMAGLYKVLSPKDPLVAARRVLLPWSDVAPASRVSIGSVTPGSVTVARGEFIDVSAEVRGLAENESVLLRYTTDDGRAMDKPIDMRLSPDGQRYSARLPDDPPASERVGIAQNLRYRIEAGDARSSDFNVTVVPAPTILVDRVEYDYPEYTGFADRQVEGLGDIHAIEGTRVTIHARANSAIRTAHVDFNADGRNDLEMTASGPGARVTFDLALRDDRQTPQYASYVLRFTNDDGRPNRNPVKHPIEVEPDLPPEAAILRPQEPALDVQLNDTVMIEVEARDPDFALAEVRLRGEVAGRAVIYEQLLGAGHAGRFTARHSFTPRGPELRAGDVVEYWVIANDNRTPAPNAVESDRRQLRIVSPDPAHQPPPDQVAQGDQQKRPQDQQPGTDEQPGNSGNQSSGDAKSNANADPLSPEAQPSADNEFSREAEPSAAQPKTQTQNQNQGDNQSRDGENQPGRQGEPGQRDELNEQAPNGEQTGAGAAGGESGQSSSQPDGTRPENNAATRSANGQPQPGGETGKSSPDASPVSSQGDNDAEAFDRIRNHLERNGQLNDKDASADGDQSTGNPQQSDDIAAANGQPDRNAQRDNNELRPDAQPGANGAQQPNESFSPDAQRKTNSEFNRDAQRSEEQGQGPGDKETGRQGDDKKVDPKDNGSGSDQTNESAMQQKGSDQSPHDGESTEQPATTADDRADGTGAETRGDDLPDEQQPPRDADDESPSPGGQQTGSKGPSGAGQQQPNQGAPDSQPEMKPGEKRQQSGSTSEQTDQPEPSAGARGKRESDSQGEEGGDKAGGGEEGGGQKSPRDGTGSAGQNQSADEGAGESAEQGDGNTSPNAGRDARADGRTGQPDGETTGRGSKQRDGQGDHPGGGQQNTPNPLSRDAQRSANNETGPDPQPSAGHQRPPTGDQQNADQGGGPPTGEGGSTGTTAGEASPSTGAAPPGDAANLDYARKQTDLVLDKLANQLKQKQVDKNLLDRLGWSEDDLKRFVERWQERKEAAERKDPAGEAARRDLDDALRSLGLRRGTLGPSAVKDDTLRDLRQGYRGAVPLEYQERLRAYSQGISRARQNGE